MLLVNIVIYPGEVNNFHLQHGVIFYQMIKICSNLPLLIDYNILSRSYPVVFQIYITKGYQCILKDLGGAICDVPELSSSHKEADARLAFHAVYASCLPCFNRMHRLVSVV